MRKNNKDNWEWIQYQNSISIDPIERESHSALVLKNFMLVFNGRNETNSRPPLEIFNISTKCWTNLSPNLKSTDYFCHVK